MKSFSKASKMAAVLTVTLACLSVTSAQAVVTKATVRSISGSATVSTDKGATWKPLRVGNSLTPNSIIKTAADTKVELVLNQNGPVVRVPADTTVGVDKLEPKVAAAGNASSAADEEATEIKVIETTGPVIKPETAITATPFALPSLTASLDTAGGISAINVAKSGNKLFTIDAAGNRFDADVTVELKGGGGTGARALAKVVNGEVVSLIVIEPGTGYTTAPTVSLKALPPLPSTIPTTIKPGYTPVQQAVLKPVVVNGKIVSVEVVNGGKNYTVFNSVGGVITASEASLDVVFEGGTSSALVLVQSRDGVITSVRVVDGGAGYAATTTAKLVSADGTDFVPFNPNLAKLELLKPAPVVVIPGDPTPAPVEAVVQYVPPPKAVAAVESTGSAKVTVTTVVDGVEVKTDKTVELFSLSTTKEIVFDTESAAQYITVTKATAATATEPAKAAVVFVEPPKVTVSEPTVKYAYNDARLDLVPRGGTDDTDEYGRPTIRAAKIEAVLDDNGKIVGLIVIDPGYGYTSPPKITIEPPPQITEEVKAIIEIAKVEDKIIVQPKVEAKIDKQQGGIVESITLKAPKESFTYEPNKTYELLVEKPKDKNGTTARAVVMTDGNGKLILNLNGDINVVITDPGLGYDKSPKAFFTEDPIVERKTVTPPPVTVVEVKKDEIIEVSTLIKP